MIVFIPHLIISIIMIIIFYVVANWVRNMISQNILINNYNSTDNVLSEIEQKRNKKIFFYELGEIAYYLIMIFGIIFSITNLGFQSATILTILGTLIVGVSLSMQSTIGNIWAGLYISLSQLYNIGDRIAINTVSGIVTNFTLFNTVVYDDKTNAEITIPNTIIQNGLLINYSI
jgi:small conductance mechanosensitive channel